MDTQTRHALKQDGFAEATASSIGWIETNRSTVIRLAILVVVVAALAIAGAVIYNSRSDKADNLFGEAMDVYNTALQAPGQPALPNTPVYKTAADRSKAANPLFVQVADNYSFFETGKNAAYFAGLTYIDLNQTASAEKELQKASDAHDSDIASLSKMALAGLYRQTGRESQAIDVYNDVIKHPTTAVPESAAKLELASLYETSNPALAKKLYAEIKDKDKGSAAAQIATQKLAGGK
ncbi:tetratricopeptide repeat protein [Silvibacterium sp.]|uniref:tetratricopeptide repeat protein n=1 Tax=Silvibacterium sp. TaxID=1964179 RepID=UPI0039E597A5